MNHSSKKNRPSNTLTLGYFYMDYQELRSWRDICEHLNGCWYKFDDEGGIIQKCPNINRQLVAFEGIFREESFPPKMPHGRPLRAALWDRWLIQFIRWGDHPILDFKNSKANKELFKGDRGWILVSGWEAKIDFLEKLVLFGEDEETLPKLWQPLARARMEEREARRIQTRGSKIERFENGLCPHCGAAQITLMMDCTSCGKCYEEF